MSRRNQDFVTKDECERVRESCATTVSIEKVNLALWGEDGRGGIVKDIQDIKSQFKIYGGTIGRFGLPIVVAVIVAVLVRFL